MKQLYEIGEKVELSVVAVQAGTVFLELNAKSEGVLDAAEVSDAMGKCTVKAGDKIAVYYIGNVAGEEKFTTRITGTSNTAGGNARGQAHKRADAFYATLERAYVKSIPVEGQVEKEIRGGYEVSIGDTRAFCPYSMAGMAAHEDTEGFIGRTMTFRIAELRDGGCSIVLSRRAIEEEQRQAASSKLAGHLHVDDVVEGRVASVRDFGAFVDIEGVTALLPISEISFERVSDVSQYVKEGQAVRVKVIGMDWERGRVSVSLKALLRDPWEDAADKYALGTKHDGKVSRAVPYGVFVELESGLEGLMHISAIEGLERNTNLAQVYHKGDKVTCMVTGIDTAERRLSLAPTTSEEVDRETQQYMANQDNAAGAGGDEYTYNPFAALLKK